MMVSRPKSDDENGDRRRRFKGRRATTSNAGDNGRHRCNDSRTARGMVEPMGEPWRNRRESGLPSEVMRVGRSWPCSDHPDRPAGQAHKVFHGRKPIREDEFEGRSTAIAYRVELSMPCGSPPKIQDGASGADSGSVGCKMLRLAARQCTASHGAQCTWQATGRAMLDDCAGGDTCKSGRRRGWRIVSLPLGCSHGFQRIELLPARAGGLGVERRSRPAVVEAIVHVPLL